MVVEGEPDPCVGMIPGVSHACCGHGVVQDAYVLLGGQPGQPADEGHPILDLRAGDAVAFFDHVRRARVVADSIERLRSRDAEETAAIEAELAAHAAEAGEEDSRPAEAEDGHVHPSGAVDVLLQGVRLVAEPTEEEEMEPDELYEEEDDNASRASARDLALGVLAGSPHVERAEAAGHDEIHVTLTGGDVITLAARYPGQRR